MQYVLYGTGWEAEKFIYSFPERDAIRYCIDGKRGGNFYGLPIYRLDKLPDNLHNYYILVAAAWNNYLEIEKSLEKRGFIPFENFVWTRALNKKILLINANCHGEFYREYLYKIPGFLEEYCEFFLPSVAENEDGEIPESWLRNCDIYLHQDIQAANSKSYRLSDEYVLPKLKDGCKAVCVPNFVGLGKAFYPSSMGLKKSVSVAFGSIWMFDQDRLLDKGYEKYHTIAGIKKLWLSEDAIEEDEIRRLFQDRLDKMLQREKNWDIKVSDIVLNNYKDKKLFWDSGHPTNALMLPVCARMAVFLGLQDIENTNITLERRLDFVEAFVLPCVKKALRLNWTEEGTIRKGEWVFNKLEGSELTVEEYIRQYIWWFKGVYLEE